MTAETQRPTIPPDPIRLTRLEAYEDDRGNRIRFSGVVDKGVSLKFRGSNNELVIADDVRFGTIDISFDANNGRLEFGASTAVPAFHASIRVGQDSAVLIGRQVSTANRVTISAAEGTTIRIGRDVMFASGIQVRADDGHAIFHVRTGKRVNWSRDITIGPHVWVGANAAILAGTEIGEGSVVALGAIVRGRFPNNCIIGGVPARILRRDIAWERPHTSLREPFYKPDASTVRRSRYWNLTKRPPSPARRVRGLLGRLVRRVRRGVR